MRTSEVFWFDDDGSGDSSELDLWEHHDHGRMAVEVARGKDDFRPGTRLAVALRRRPRAWSAALRTALHPRRAAPPRDRFTAHALHHSLVAELHCGVYGPVGRPECLHSLEANGLLRAGHEAFHEFAPELT
jgi:hypothetical protein